MIKKNVINVYMYEEWCLFVLYMYKTTIQKGCVVFLFMTNNIHSHYYDTYHIFNNNIIQLLLF